MSYIKSLEKKVNDYIEEAGYKVDDFKLSLSNRPDLGDYQVNDAMKLASTYGENPRIIAEKIVEKLKEDKTFIDINIAGPGFINIKLSEETLLKFASELSENIENNIDKGKNETTIIDYGGANVAKVLHVGHLRSANIGEAMKRIAMVKGDNVIGDVHLGDSGLQAGMVVSELKFRFPELPCFQAGYDGEDFELPIKSEDLNEIYPVASSKAKADEKIYSEASEITLQIQKGDKAYNKVWAKVIELSLGDIKKTYEILNTNFDLWEGEMDSLEYIPEALDIIKEQGLLYESEGAMVVDVSDPKDTKEMPPAIMVKGNGAYLYETTDVGTILGRMKRFNPDKIWYVVDKRQSLHFESVFRVVKKAAIVNENTELDFRGFGTMNGPDGKPFKTRDGGVMTLNDLIQMVYEETAKKVSIDTSDDKKEDIAKKVAIAALKFADLLPQRLTDYIFDPSKFADLEGKTGPYILYANIRMKSMLDKSGFDNYKIIKLAGNYDRTLLINLLQMPKIIDSAYNEGTPSDIAEYVYVLSSNFNKFYAENHVLGCEDETQKKSWLALVSILHQATTLLINTLGIDIPEKM